MHRLALIAAACLFARDALAQTGAPPPTPIGTWRGTSTCLVRPSPCKDEVVVYRVAAGNTADSVSIDGRKIVKGQEEEMGVLTCHVADATGRVTCAIPQGIWRFTPRADSLVGELRLNDGARVRAVRATRRVAAPGPPAGKRQVIKLERFRKALWKVHVTVNGKPGDFLLDTGGGNTLLTDQFASGIECKYWGRTTGYNMFGKRNDGPHCDDVHILAGDVALTPVSVSSIDFGDQFAGDKVPDGLLSLDALDGKAFTLDQVAGTLTIETASSLAERTAHMQELPFRVSRECSARCLSVFVGVPTAQGMTWLILDSGAGGVSLIAKEYAEVFGLDPKGKDQRLQCEIAPGVTVDSPVLVTDMIMDGNLGQPFMSRYILTFDLAHGRLWVGKT